MRYRQLITVHKNQLRPLPNSVMSYITSVPWNQTWLEYLHQGNWQMLQIGAYSESQLLNISQAPNVGNMSVKWNIKLIPIFTLWGKKCLIIKRYVHAEKMSLDPHLTPYTKINSKWIIDLDVRAKTINLQKKTQKKSSDFGLGQGHNPIYNCIKREWNS